MKHKKRSNRLVNCPACKQRVRANLLERHNLEYHRVLSEAEQEALAVEKEKKKRENLSLTARVKYEEDQLRLKHLVAAARYREAEKKRQGRRKWQSPRKKGKQSNWPSKATMTGNSPFLIYGGAFEMNRRKH